MPGTFPSLSEVYLANFLLLVAKRHFVLKYRFEFYNNEYDCNVLDIMDCDTIVIIHEGKEKRKKKKHLLIFYYRNSILQRLT